MAYAFKCDRCGRYYTTKPNVLSETNYEIVYGENVYSDHEFCDDCIDDFREFCKGVPPKTLAEKLRSISMKG